MIFFISDTHLGHQRIINWCKRPFSSLIEMDLTLIRNWNTKVKSDDTVFHLGDFCFAKSSEAPDSKVKAFEYYRQQLKGNIIFVAGNHDRNNKNNTIVEGINILYGGQRMYLVHNPKFAKPEYSINLCGHMHEKWACQRLSKNSIIVNMSVEQWNYQPVTINEILSRATEWVKNER